MALKMWTVVTHLITCCVNLTFAFIFSGENILMYDGIELRRLAQVGRQVVRTVEEWSSIAKRGGKLLDILFELADELGQDGDAQFRIEHIIKRVSEVDGSFQGDLVLGSEHLGPIFDFSFNGS